MSVPSLSFLCALNIINNDTNGVFIMKNPCGHFFGFNPIPLNIKTIEPNIYLKACIKEVNYQVEDNIKNNITNVKWIPDLRFANKNVKRGIH